MKPNQNWYTQTLEQVLEGLGPRPDSGLSESEVKNLQAEYGLNELVERGAKPPWRILLDQFRETMVIVLLVAALISGFLGDLKDLIAILAIVIINAVLGFVQEYRAERAMAALKRMSAPNVKVRRDGHVLELPSRELVPGDIFLMEVGDAVPADARLIESANLRVQEASLTGESVPVEKSAASTAEPGVALGDDKRSIGTQVKLSSASTYLGDRDVERAIFNR